MPADTIFTDVVAVQAWDAWFRWRDQRGLRDRTIEWTWSRVAQACAAAEGAQSEYWADRYRRAMSRWHLLPDERVLARAGTDLPMEGSPSLGAALHVGSFLLDVGSPSARLELASMVQAAALAVRLLEGACLLAPPGHGEAQELRVGVVGLAEALHRLGLAYDSPGGRALAGEVAAALATGTLLGSVELARGRGGQALSSRQRERLQAPETPEQLRDAALHWGARHTHLTALDPRPRLALLANATSDALDPMQRPTAAAASEHPSLALPSLDSQLRMRAAMQPWIDAPIDYPLAAAKELAPQELDDLARIARSLGLPEPRLRLGLPAQDRPLGAL